MKITVPKISGFCYGVSLAIRAAEKVINDGEKLLMYGEIVHNPSVVGKLEKHGGRVIESVDEITDGDKDSNASVLIRAHGVSKEIQNRIINTGLKVVDCTCPKVKKVHEIVAKESELKRRVIIIGSADHPEVKGILGWCGQDTMIIPDYKTAVEANMNDGCSVVVQTTFNIDEFKRISELLQSKCSDIKIFDTICPATDIRQKTVNDIAKACDFAIIVGGKNSSNSKKLYSIAKSHCDAVQIENAEELDLELLENREKVLVSAGSSTPIELVKQVVDIIARKYNAEVEYK